MAIRTFFDSLTLASVEAMPAQAVEETLHLDFKTTKTPDFSSRDDRKIFAEAASGFANSEGGVLIWGVEAKANAEGFDCARTLVPIANVASFAERLKALSHECTSPAITGIEHQKFERVDGSGFAASYIPESDGGPHMAKLGEDRYFRRNGRSFLRMEHFEIADMFGRRPQPKLEIAWRPTHGATAEIAIVLGIRNIGRGGARAPYLALTPHAHPWRWDSFGLDGNRNEGMTRHRVAAQGYDLTYSEGADFVIHPGTTRDVAKFSIPPTVTDPSPLLPAGGLLTFDYQLCADGHPLIRSILHIQLRELGISVGAV